MSNIIDSIQLSGTTYQIQGSGGGKPIEGGRGISVTTGATADTVSFDLPISAGSQSNSVVVNFNGNNASGWMSFVQGRYTFANNQTESAFGNYNRSSNSSNSFGDSGNTLFAVGNGESLSHRHNSFEILQNGDIYIADTNDTSTTNYWEKPMIKLQDAIGGGGSTYTAGDGIDITNDIISVTGKADTSAVTEVSDALTAHTADTTIHVTTAEKTAWNGAVSDISTISGDVGTISGQVSTNTSNISTVSASTASNTIALGGMTILKLSQAQYDALDPNYDSNTLYVIVN